MVHDISGVGSALDLVISDEAAVTWTPGGLAINAPALIASPGAASKVINACQASNELTIEAWIRPANVTQAGPARIVTLSRNTRERNFTLGQGLWDGQPTALIDVRLRTTATSDNGIPSLSSPGGSLTTGLSHVVYTRDADGNATLYINGMEQISAVVGGDFSNWDSSHQLALANELTGDRPWLGELQLVAIYCRALSYEEVEQNFSAGADGSGCQPPGDIDRDGQVTVLDIQNVAAYWKTVPPDSRYDQDGDGDVDIVDVMLVAANLNATCGSDTDLRVRG